MNAITQTVTPVIITTGATSLLFVMNPVVFYGALAIFVVTCVVFCVSIIKKCNERVKRLEQLKTRKDRRAHGNPDTTEHGGIH